MERWMDINGFEGMYQISDHGNVVSYKSGKRKQLKNRVNADGYHHVALRKDGKAHERITNRLVAQHFIPNPYNKDTVNHIDGNKTNNHYTNLEWADRREQLVHAYKLGLKQQPTGSKSGISVLTREQVIEIRNRYKPHCCKNGVKPMSIEYGVSFPTIDKCIRRVTYKDVP